MSEKDEEINNSMIMPFIVCESQGGSLNDNAFVIGYELGELDTYLFLASTLQSVLFQINGRYVHSAGLPQLDLIAMHYGYTLEIVETDESGEWTWVEFIPYQDELEESNIEE